MPLVIDGQSAAQAAQLRQQLKDTSEQLKQTQAALRQAQAELARVARVTTMGELAASIAHEVNQPLSAIVLNAGAGLHWLKRDEPDLLQVRQAFDMIVTAGRRAGDIIRGIRRLARKSGPERAEFVVDDAMEAIAAAPLTKQRREIRLRSAAIVAGGGIQLSVEDSGAGLAPELAGRVFEPLFSTKPEGMGMGLSICRSIVAAHGGRIWATPGLRHGAAFHVSLPRAGADIGGRDCNASQVL